MFFIFVSFMTLLSLNVQLLLLMLLRFFFQLHFAWAKLGGLAHRFGFGGGLNFSFEASPKLWLKRD